MKPRPYQSEALRALSRALEEQDSTILALPTGSGKTFVAATWLLEHYAKHGKRIVWIAHRRELLEQAYSTFTTLAAELVPRPSLSWYVRGSGFDPTGDIVFASVRSAQDYPEASADIVVIDEAHHEAAASYQHVLDRIQAPKKLGLTATPTRLDERPLGFASIAYQKTMMELVHEGWLARPLPVIPKTRLNFDLEVRAGDIARESLSQLNSDARNAFISEHWHQNRARYGKTLVFAVNRAHAEELATCLRSMTPAPRVGVVLGDSSPAIRADRVQAFRESSLDILINVEVFTEGFDCPDTRTVMLTRPTMSPTLYLQMVGRGTRIAPGKREFYLVDFEDLLGDFQEQMIRPYVLGGEVQPEASTNDVAVRDVVALPEALNLIQRYQPVSLDEIAGYVVYSTGPGESGGYFVHQADEGPFLEVWRSIEEGAPDESLAAIQQMVAMPLLLRKVARSKFIGSLLALLEREARYVRLRARSIPPKLKEFLIPAGLTEQEELELGQNVDELWAAARYYDDELSDEMKWVPIFRLERAEWQAAISELEDGRNLRGKERRELLHRLYATHLQDCVVTAHQWERFATFFAKAPEQAILFVEPLELEKTVSTQEAPPSTASSEDLIDAFEQSGVTVEQQLVAVQVPAPPIIRDQDVSSLATWRQRLSSIDDFHALSANDQEQIRQQFGSVAIFLVRLGLLPTLADISKS